MLDGEPNASDKPATVKQECFPPALRYRVDENGKLTDQRTEPIAGDLRKGGDGWRGAFLKAVSGITGLGFDALARREQKRRKRRILTGSVAAAIVAVFLLVVGYLQWDYNRVKVNDYANLAVRWGVPEGVGQLDEATRYGREVHYRIESRQNKVRKVLRLNSAGELRDDEDNHSVSIKEIFYGEGGFVQKIDLRDHNEKLVMRKKFSGLIETDEGHVLYIQFKLEYQDSRLALAAPSDEWVTKLFIDIMSKNNYDITAQRVLYNADGLEGVITYLSVDGKKRANTEGVFGQRFEYDDSTALPTNIVNLGNDGEPLPSRSGVASAHISHSLLGEPIEWHYFGADTLQPTLHPYGYHRITWVYDARGNTTEKSYFGIDGEKVRLGDIYHRITWVYDARGNTTEVAYFGVGGKPVLKNLYHRQKQVFDERGNVIEYVYFGINGEKVMFRKGSHRVTRVYDSRGNVSKESFFGINGERVLHHNGYHRYTQVLDKRGYVTEKAYFGTDGDPMLYINEYHKITQVSDSYGNLVEKAYFGIDGEPVLYINKYHKITQVSDAYGNLVDKAYFGIDGEPVLYRNKYHRITWFYHDNLKYESLFDEDGNPIE